MRAKGRDAGSKVVLMIKVYMLLFYTLNTVAKLIPPPPPQIICIHSLSHRRELMQSEALSWNLRGLCIKVP